jgi:hypothetical protein
MLWTRGAPITVNSRVFVAEVDLDDLVLELNSNGAAALKGVDVVALSTEAANSWEVTRVVLDAKKYDVLVKSDSLDRKALRDLCEQFDASLHRVLAAIAEFLHAVWLAEPIAVHQALEPLTTALNETKRIPSTSRVWGARLAKYLTMVVDRGHRTWSYPAPYECSRLSPSAWAWWDSPPTLTGVWTTVSSQYSTVVTNAAPASVAQVRNWVERMRQSSARLQRNPASHEYDQTFLCASAYLYTLAQHHARRRQPTLTLLHLHRAVEWLFVAKLAEANELVYTRGVQLKNNEDVSFQKAMGWCRINGVISPQQKATAEKLNEWRNHLALTHSMFAPTHAAVSSLQAEVDDLVRNVGSTEWLMHFTEASAPLPVDFALFVDANRFLRNGIRSVPVSELEIS